MKVPVELQPTWACYQLVVHGLATWTEVTTTMSIDDVDRLCMAADLINGGE